MFKTKFAKHTIKQVGSTVVAMAIASGVCLAPSIAVAAGSGWATPTTVATGKTNLWLTVGGVGYQAFTSGQPSGCSTVSADTFKAWMSLAQSALLSGKNIYVYYTDCGSSVHSIDGIDLAQ